jgi:hypothetical protein
MDIHIVTALFQTAEKNPREEMNKRQHPAILVRTIAGCWRFCGVLV